MSLHVDYLISGAGAMGMAFADVILHESDKTIALVDRRAAPGGHWNDAYPFVRLHQPSAFYGVNSRALGDDLIDKVGWNKGLYELASKGEVCAYYDRVMREQFLPSGRVHYFPNCEVSPQGEVVSLVTGATIDVTAHQYVDAGYMQVHVPATREPDYAVDEGALCVPINALPQVAGPNRVYTIIGGGKTAMDAVLWLLANDVDPQKIHWVRPRDSWILNRANIQPGELALKSQESFLRQMTEISESATPEDMFARLNTADILWRLDPEVWPSMYRCATVTPAEFTQLQRVQNVVRMGHVERIHANGLELTEGTYALPEDTVYIDCSADGLAKRPAQAIFQNQRITLQTVRFCQQVFSAAFIAHAEVTYKDDAEKNAVCNVVPHPDTDEDFIRVTLANTLNSIVWNQDEELMQWLVDARLDGFSVIRRTTDESVVEIGARAVANMQRFLAS